MRKLISIGNEKSYKIIFDGFYDATEVYEAIRVMKDVINVDDIYVVGYDSMCGYSTKDDINLKWFFSNWDCITWEYDFPENSKEIEMILEWANIVYNELMLKFPE